VTDIEEEPVQPLPVHSVVGAVQPRHTLIGLMERTNRWTLRIVLGGHGAHEGFRHQSTLTGTPFSLYDSLYCDN
jgi:hypothetical protein